MIITGGSTFALPSHYEGPNSSPSKGAITVTEKTVCVKKVSSTCSCAECQKAEALPSPSLRLTLCWRSELKVLDMNDLIGTLPACLPAGECEEGATTCKNQVPKKSGA